MIFIHDVSLNIYAAVLRLSNFKFIAGKECNYNIKYANPLSLTYQIGTLVSCGKTFLRRVLID